MFLYLRANELDKFYNSNEIECDGKVCGSAVCFIGAKVDDVPDSEYRYEKR